MFAAHGINPNDDYKMDVGRKMVRRTMVKECVRTEYQRKNYGEMSTCWSVCED